LGEMESEEILDLQFSVHWSTCSSIPGSDFLPLMKKGNEFLFLMTALMMGALRVCPKKLAFIFRI